MACAEVVGTLTLDRHGPHRYALESGGMYTVSFTMDKNWLFPEIGPMCSYLSLAIIDCYFRD